MPRIQQKFWGFISPNGEEFFQKYDTEGHAEIGKRILNQKIWNQKFAQSSVSIVEDFLVFEKGFIKVERYAKQVTFYDEDACIKTFKIINSYREKGYSVKTVHNPYKKKTFYDFL